MRVNKKGRKNPAPLYAAAASMCIALAQRLLGRLTLLAKFFQQSAEVFGVLLFLGEDFFHHPTAGRIVAAEVIDDFAIAVDRDAQIGRASCRERVCQYV